MRIGEAPEAEGGRKRQALPRRPSPTSGVALPVALTLCVQAAASMSTIAIPVLMPVASTELDIPASMVGIFMSLVYLGATASAPISGHFIDRYGPIAISQACLALCALGLAAFAVPSIPLMAAGSLVLGLGYGPVTPASSHLLVRTTPLAIMSVVFSIKQTGVPLGGAMAGAIVPPLVLRTGWNLSALWTGGFVLLLAFALQPYRKRYDTEKSAPPRLSLRNLVAPVKMVTRHPQLRLLAVASFFFSTMQLCLTSFLVTYLMADVALDLVAAGILLSVAQTSGIAGRILWGAFADRFVRPRLMLGLLGAAMAAGALATALFSPQWPYPAVLCACILFGSSAIGWNGVFLAEVARVATPELTGVATGGSLFFTFAGVLFGLPVFALVVAKTGSYPLGFAIVAAATFLCGAALVFSKPAL